MKKEFNPKVSIVIPVYNGSRYVREAIDSALGQTYKNIEILVVNDGSNDGGETDKICKSYGERIRYFSKENGGVATALNKGVEEMNGEYLSWLSHDDVYCLDKVEKEVNTLRELSNKKTIIYSNLEIIDENGNHIEDQRYEVMYGKDRLNKPLFAFFHLALNGCTMLIHKSHFERVGMFNPKLRTTQDYDLWFRILRNAKIYHHKDLLLKSRSHSEQGSKALLDIHVDECNVFWMNVFNSITKKEIIETLGSEENFYLDLYHSFKSLTLYDKIISYLFSKTLEIYRQQYQETNVSKIKNIVLKKIISEIGDNTEGFKRTITQLLRFKNQKKKRIVFFTGNWHDRAGLNRVISRISTFLSTKYDVFVVCMKEKGNNEGYKLGSKVRFIELEYSEFYKIPKLLKLLGTDVFVVSNNCSVPVLNMFGEIESLGMRIIAWNHEHFFVPYYEDSLNESVLIREKAFQEASIILWLTEFSARLGRIFSDRVVVMTNPLSFSAQRKNKKKLENNHNIISLARFDSPRKHLDYLILVFANILKKIPDAKLYVLGSYDLNMKTDCMNGGTIAELIKKKNISTKNLIFVGEVKDVKPYYSKARVNIMTSEREGFGLTVIEAALFGIPSVVFGGGGMEDIIQNNKDGFVIRKQNVEDMAQKTIQLFEDEKLYLRMSKETVKMINNYKEKEIVNRWEKLINGVIKLPKEELSSFIKLNFSERKNFISSNNFEDVVLMYEKAFKNKIEEIKIKNIEIEELSTQLERFYAQDKKRSIIVKLILKFDRLIELIKIQGIKKTLSNIIIKIKNKI